MASRSAQPATGCCRRSTAPRAVRCALDMIEAARATGLDIRAGVHTGEIEHRGQDLVGIAVHIGARVAALASPGEVLVSGAVPPLVVGSGLDFVDHGKHELRACPGPRASSP